MSDPWFEPVWQFGAYFGGIGGALVGCLGGVLGSCSYFVAKGQGRPWILGAYTTMLVLGVLSLLVGIYAVVDGQPYGIWYPFLLLGGVSTAVFGGLLPMIRAKYREAEQRKIDAEGVRGI